MRDTIPSAVRVDSPKARLVGRDEVIPFLKAGVKYFKEENVGLQDQAMARKKGHEEAKKRETTFNNILNKANGAKGRGCAQWSRKLGRWDRR